MPSAHIVSDLAAMVAPRPAPETCTSMIEVRQGVDALDRALVGLLAERQRYMDAAARIKTERTAVRDVFVDGKPIVRDGRHPRREEVVREFAAVQERLWR